MKEFFYPLVWVIRVATWLVCGVAWFFVWLSERYSPNNPRLRSFKEDQSDLWVHLTKNLKDYETY